MKDAGQRLDALACSASWCVFGALGHKNGGLVKSRVRVEFAERIPTPYSTAMRTFDALLSREKAKACKTPEMAASSSPESL